VHHIYRWGVGDGTDDIVYELGGGVWVSTGTISSWDVSIWLCGGVCGGVWVGGGGSGPGFEPFGIRATFIIVTTGYHTILMLVFEDGYDPRDPEERDSHIYIRILVIT
jgi:hypothetical protein